MEIPGRHQLALVCTQWALEPSRKQHEDQHSEEEAQGLSGTLHPAAVHHTPASNKSWGRVHFF